MCACMCCKDHRVQCEKEETIRRNVEKRRKRRRQNEAEQATGAQQRRGAAGGGRERRRREGAEAKQRFFPPAPITPLLLCVCRWCLSLSIQVCAEQDARGNGGDTQVSTDPRARERRKRRIGTPETHLLALLLFLCFCSFARRAARSVSVVLFVGRSPPSSTSSSFITGHPPAPRSLSPSPSRATPPLLPSLCDTITLPVG